MVEGYLDSHLPKDALCAEADTELFCPDQIC
jgi:hypothetical protein